MYSRFIKLTLDFILSLIGIILMSPILILTFIVLGVSLKGNPIFLQQRSGKIGHLFYIYKFRTMNNKRDQDGKLLCDAERITKIGSIIRKTSIDELPQLFNVLKFEMSLVGPRPLLPEYLPLYNSFQNKRHSVKPGITGWAQVNGRNAIGWDKKFELDVWYAENISFQLDVKIIFKTILKVIQRKGISASVLINMEPFKGNEL